ncbi:MAG: sulfur oxidation c-type cytochrome SoxA [Pseudomonadota bacterium]|nr:sulfur oxidation c-type cytochrome SoxA [Pseudomonadota bacterium]
MNIQLFFYSIFGAMALSFNPVHAQDTVSGYDYLIPEMQEMQDDDFGNPGMIMVDAGEALFSTAGETGKSCTSCHGNGGEKFDTGHIATYPLYSTELKKPLTLRGQILSCRNDRVGGAGLDYASKEILQLEAFVRRLALGEIIKVDISGKMAPYHEAGKKLFHTRWGQVDIACHQCHVYHAGRTFRGQILSQGQSNGFPGYRYTAGISVGLHERITGCLNNLRAEPYAIGSDEYINFEVYMNARSNGLKVETPAIRY